MREEEDVTVAVTVAVAAEDTASASPVYVRVARAVDVTVLSEIRETS